MTKVFVYGTLKKGGRLHYFLEKAKFLEEFETAPKYTMYDMGSFPGVRDEGATAIKGEIYEVDAKTLKRLDALEGNGRGFYNRVILKDDVYIYIIEKPMLSRSTAMETGIWPVDKVAAWN